MRHGWRSGLLGVTGLIALLAAAPPAWAVEYRLQVVSLFESAFVSFLKAGEFEDGASGPGLARLEASLDGGGVPSGVVLFDRRVQPVRSSLARAWGGAPVVPRIKPAGEGSTFWDEITWEGKPGERSVWIVSPTIRNVQEVYNVALKGAGPLRHFRPYAAGLDGTGTAALSIPLNFLWFYEERGTVWDRYIGRSLDLREGIGAVAGVNSDALFPDQVYLIVSQAEQPTTYKAVLVWRERSYERQAPSNKAPIDLR